MLNLISNINSIISMKYLPVIFLRLIIFFGIIIMINGCIKTKVTGCTDPTASNYNPKAVVDDGSSFHVQVAACVKNNTGDVYFINQSSQDTTFDIFWDGVDIATIAPGNNSNTFTFTAGAYHSLVVKYTKSQLVRSTGSRYITQCSKNGYSLN